MDVFFIIMLLVAVVVVAQLYQPANSQPEIPAGHTEATIFKTLDAPANEDVFKPLPENRSQEITTRPICWICGDPKETGSHLH